MSGAPSRDHEVVTALREFVARIGVLTTGDDRGVAVRLAVATDVGATTIELSPDVARAFVAALVGYHDPRDVGRCERCGGRLDANLMCRDCERPNGIFGQLLLERFARHDGPPTAR